MIRPIRAEDEPALAEFFKGLSSDSLHLRFQKCWSAPRGETLRSLARVDYRRHMAFVCIAAGRIVGEARYFVNPDERTCEFAIAVADDWHNAGVGGLLMEVLISAARERGIERMEGLVLRENADMLRFVRALGFEAHHEPEDPALTRVSRRL